jgi:hypothetical protein
MKAYEWSTRFNAAFNGKGGDVFHLMEEFADLEIRDFILQRTKNSKLGYVKAAVDGAMREAESKWAAIQRQCPLLQTTRIQDLIYKTDLELHLKKYAYEFILEKAD